MKESQTNDDGRFSQDFADELDRLIGESESVIKPFREKYRETMAFFAGEHYAQKDNPVPVFMNKLQQAVLIYSRVLSARNPQAMIKSKSDKTKFMAMAFESVMNADIKRLELDREMQRIITDALFFVGISKTGLCSSDSAYDLGDVRIDPGKPFISRVSPDDFFFDTSAQTLAGCQFLGDVVEMDKDFVLTSGEFGTKEEVLEWIGASSQATAKQDGVRTLSGAQQKTDTRLYPTVLMREVYLPRERKIIYMPWGAAKIVRVQDWVGPESGPYELLAFMQMPDNIMPIPLVQAWYNLAHYINNLIVKITKDAEAQKKGYLVYADSPEDGRLIQAMKNGDVLAITKSMAAGGGKAIGEEINVGGVNQNVFVFLQWMITTFDEMAGNLSLLGGLSAQSATATQDTILNSRASVMEYDMRSHVVNFMKRTLEKFGSFLWSDPIREMEAQFRVTGPDVKVDSAISPEDRSELPFEDFGLEIIPYSMEFRSPKTERAEYIEDVNLMAPYLQQNGYRLNIPKFVEGIEKRGNIDDLTELVEQEKQDPMAMMGAEQGGGGKNVLQYQSTVSPVKQHMEKRVSDTTNKGVAAQFAGAMNGD